MNHNHAAGPVAVWTDITNVADESTVEALFHQPIDYVVARVDQLRELHVPSRIKRACVLDGHGLDETRDYADVLVVDDTSAALPARASGLPVAVRTRVHDADSLDACREAARTADALLVTLTDPTNIPLELLIAENQTTGVDIVKRVEGASDAMVSLGVLETGPDGVMFAVDGLGEIGRVSDYIAEAQRTRLELVESTVTSARSLGVGYRACVDTVSLMEKDEGFVVGSTSSGGLVLCAEVHYLPYMNLRPFRVNAGAVHSYIWGPRLTEYLTDLATGSSVLIVNTDGVARPTTVGRVKTEVRSLRLIEAEANGVPLNVFVQDDWHVRLFDADGAPRNCTTIRPGDKMLAHVCAPGRHVGIPVDETIEER